MQSPLARRVIARRALIAVSAALLTVPLAANAANASPGGRSTLSGSIPGWLKAAHAVGSPSSAQKISFNVVLPLRNAAGAEALAANVSNPNGAAYGHYLTANQFNATYAPTAAQVAKVQAYLKGAGVTVTGVAAGNRWVSATGTVKQIESAFATTLRNYSYRGHTMREASTGLSVPTGIRGLISGIIGVSDESPLNRPQNLPRTPSFNDSTGAAPSAQLPPTQPCSAYYDQYEQVVPEAYGKTSYPTPGCGFVPSDLRTAYGMANAVSHGDDGTGITVAIIDAYDSPTIVADTNDYSTFAGDQPFAAGQYTSTDLGTPNSQDVCGPDGWNVEQSIDVQMVHGMAPGANIHYIGAASCQDADLDAALNYVVQNHTANIISNSWDNLGEDGLADEATAVHSIFLQGALEGIGFYFSSGDDGDNVVLGGLSHPEPDWPSTDPLVTSVGGAMLTVKADGSYNFEQPWGPDVARVDYTQTPAAYLQTPPGAIEITTETGAEFSDGAGGGGTSALFKEPAYQKLLVPSSLAKANGHTPMRVVPDVAGLADPDLSSFFIEYAGNFYQYGGTSVAAPMIAGIQAIASQNRLFPIGSANPLLYALGLTGIAFHDIKPPKTGNVVFASSSGRTLFTLGHDTSMIEAKGFDNSTGLGSPNGTAFLIGEAILP